MATGSDSAPLSLVHLKASLPIEMAAGKAPDMSHLDAGVCKVMEDAVEDAGAETAEEIRAAVKKAWKKTTPEFSQRVSGRVWENMGEVIRLKESRGLGAGAGARGWRYQPPNSTSDSILAMSMPDFKGALGPRGPGPKA